MLGNNAVKKSLKRIGIVLGVCMLAFALLGAYAKYVSNSEQTVELGTNNDEFRFEYNIAKMWSENSHNYKAGMQYDLEIENFTSQSIYDWRIVLNMTDNCHLDSYWNGQYNLEDNVLTVTCVDYNDVIRPSDMQPFGMIIWGNEVDNIVSGKMIFHQNKRIYEMPIFWIMVLATIVSLASTVTGLFYSIKNETLKKKQKESLRIINQSFITFANTIDAKDSYTKGHSQRVAVYARELAKRMGMDEEFQSNIFYVGLLHDIGKIGVQDAILKKSAKLTYDEFNEIKEHVSMGGDILKKFTAIKNIEDGARYHHERYDGTGYMEGLKGEEIPLLARIISVADAFDAMSSARCYRQAMDMEKIIAEFKEHSGTQFDPNIVPHMLDMIEEGVAPVELSQGQLETELELEL